MVLMRGLCTKPTLMLLVEIAVLAPLHKHAENRTKNGRPHELRVVIQKRESYSTFANGGLFLDSLAQVGGKAEFASHFPSDMSQKLCLQKNNRQSLAP